MTAPHKATPEQWRWVSEDACLIELRDRLTAAEQRISELEQRPIPGSVELATDAELIKAWDMRNGDHMVARICFIYNLGHQHGTAQAACPHIVTSEDGTSYCQLAEQNNHPAIPDSSLPLSGGLAEDLAAREPSRPQTEPAALSDALIKAECALADIAEGAPSTDEGDPVQWAEERCANALSIIRPVMQQYGIRTSELSGAGFNPPQPVSSVELVERVAQAIKSANGFDDDPAELWEDDAHAAIREVAEWFDAIGYGTTASILRQEVKRD